MLKKPTFFISSTIFDFRDLRSAVKFYLEEQGCAVLASECNDFGQPLDVHSYEACLNQIEAADYFILLIGSRIGGWYDETTKVSITRREYRRAYELHLQGRLKIISFVRSDVWAVKDDRKELGRFLDSMDIDPAKVASIKSRPGKAASDAEFLIEFLEEVGHNKQTANAVRGAATLPTGNWIHVFSSFREIMDVLRGQVFSGRPVDQAIGRQLLRSELLEMTSRMLMKLTSGTVLFPFKALETFANSCPLRISQLSKTTIVVDRASFEQFFVAFVHFGGAQLHVQGVDRILSSDVLLEFDPKLGTFEETEIYQALVKLRSEVRTFMRINEGGSLVAKAGNALQSAGAGNAVTIGISELVALRSLSDRAANIVLLARASIRCLDGAEFEMPQLRPSTPFEGQVEQLEKERVSVADTLRFIAQ